MKLDDIQSELREQRLDGWLFYDHHHRDPIAYRVLGLDPGHLATRRWYYWLPSHGEPHKLVHRVEQFCLDSLVGTKQVYSSWQELDHNLRSILADAKKLAMQYSVENAIPSVSLVDAGTIEAIRAMGKTIVSSADLVSRFEAVLSSGQIASHYEAQRRIDEILAAAWSFIGERIRHGGLKEYDVVVWLRQAMERAGLEWEHGPDVSTNANTSDPHYEPAATQSARVRNGDFLLIDIWGRMKRPGTCFYDITWTAVVGREPNEREQQILDLVIRARDSVIEMVQDTFAQNQQLAGWQADDRARQVIREAGFGDYFTHRTGHNIAADLHGNGAHLDNLETHDERVLLPCTCFSVEPGIYLPEFGMRSEINMLTEPGKAVVTGKVQKQLVRI